jgi:uncharacterized membrane protein required for colicin V production
MPNVFDAVLVAIIGGALFWGWKSGLLRQLVAVSAALAAFIVARQLYEPLGYFFTDLALVPVPGFYQALSYLLVMTFTAAVWLWAIYRLYPFTRLTEPDADTFVRSLDRLGGMFLSVILGVLLALGTIGVSELLASSRWPAFESIDRRSAIHYAIQDSLLVRTLFSEAPDFVDHVGTWVPGVAIAREGRFQS